MAQIASCEGSAIDIRTRIVKIEKPISPANIRTPIPFAPEFLDRRQGEMKKIEILTIV